METVIESIKEFGILTPLVARKKENERYGMLARMVGYVLCVDLNLP